MEVDCCRTTPQNTPENIGHVFVSSMNPLSGKLEWVTADDSYDFHQEIARSAYADMLHDSERNEKYYAAIMRAIEIVKGRSELVHVLDIGTGSGLLSMMAVKGGADSVTACEVFNPMANCARHVFSSNGMATKVKLVAKRSTELTVGPGCDLECRANVLVAEVFDTELIGEGAIETFLHAHRELLTSDAIVIPSRATVFAQVVQSKFIRRWHQLFSIPVSGSISTPLNISGSLSQCTVSAGGAITTTGNASGSTTPVLSGEVTSPASSLVAPITGTPAEVAIRVPAAMEVCPGAPSPHDLQLSQIPRSLFETLCEPIAILAFDFTKLEIPTSSKTARRIDITHPCYADAVFVWWSLDMDPDGQVILSCAPHWVRPDEKELQWRDHWLQAIYYPPQALNLDAGQAVLLHAAHDQFSLFFDVTLAENISNNNECGKDDNGFSPSKRRGSWEPKPKRVANGRNGDGDATFEERPVCHCGLHVSIGRSRIGQLNERQRSNKYSLVLSEHLRRLQNPAVLCLGDSNMLSLLCAVLAPSAKIFCVEPNPGCASVIEALVSYNNLINVKVIRKQADAVTRGDLDELTPSLVVAEPFFTSAYQPWHSLVSMVHALGHVRHLLSNDTTVLPAIAQLKVVALELEDLWKIRAPVGRCMGFDLGPFDHMVQSALESADPTIEPQPLWEYPGVALSEERTVLTFDLRTLTRRDSLPCALEEMILRCEDDFDFVCPGTCNGLAFWMSYTFQPPEGAGLISVVVSDGLAEPISVGRRPRWSPYHKQGVHLFKEPARVTPARNRLHLCVELSIADCVLTLSSSFQMKQDEMADMDG